MFNLVSRFSQSVSQFIRSFRHVTAAVNSFCYSCVLSADMGTTTRFLRRNWKQLTLVGTALLLYIVVGSTLTTAIQRAGWFITVPCAGSLGSLSVYSNRSRALVAVVWAAGGLSVVRARSQQNLEMAKALAIVGERETAKFKRLDSYASAVATNCFTPASVL